MLEKKSRGALVLWYGKKAAITKNGTDENQSQRFNRLLQHLHIVEYR